MDLDRTVDNLRAALTGGNAAANEMGGTALATALLVSLVCALAISKLYDFFYGARGTGSQVHRSFHLLSVAVTGIFICVQFSLPLSLGLLGALSIVRFRTPIKEPEEIGFIMLVIMTSIACATFNFKFLAIALSVAVLGLIAHALLVRTTGTVTRDHLLLVTAPEAAFAEVAAQVEDIVREALRRPRLNGLNRADGVMTATYTFGGVAGRSPASVQQRLQALSPALHVTLSFSGGGVPL